MISNRHHQQTAICVSCHFPSCHFCPNFSGSHGVKHYPIQNKRVRIWEHNFYLSFFKKNIFLLIFTYHGQRSWKPDKILIYLVVINLNLPSVAERIFALEYVSFLALLFHEACPWLVQFLFLSLLVLSDNLEAAAQSLKDVEASFLVHELYMKGENLVNRFLIAYLLKTNL